jgi:hypothetical protein
LGERLAALRRLALGNFFVAVGACAREKPPVAPDGTLEVQWVGADTGKLVAPAVAEWCDSLRMLELRAVHGDTGIALLLYPADSLTTGDYRMVLPERADSVRPSAAVALRWFAETTISGFRGDGGSLTLASVGPGALAGRFRAQLRSATEGSRLDLTGSFQRLTVHPAPADCAGVAQDPDDTMPDVAEEFEETAD